MRFLALLLALVVAQSASAETAFFGKLDIGDLFTAGGALSTHNLDAATDAVESHYVAQRAMSFDRICIRVGTNAGDPPAYKVGIQGLATSGDPLRSNGTYKTGTGECSASYDPPSGTSHNNTEQCFATTGTTCAVAAGELYSIVVVPTGVPDGSNYLQMAYTQNAFFNDTTYFRNNIEQVVTVNGGTPTETQYTPISYIKLNSSGDAMGNPFKTNYQNYYDDASNPDEYCNRIYYDLPSGCSYTLSGAGVYWGSSFGAGATFEVRLYDATPTQLDSVAVDADQTTGIGASRFTRYYFDDGDSLADATAYFLCIKHTGSGNGFILESEVEANANFNAWPGGKEIYKATRNNGSGSFTTTDTRRMAIYPILGSISCSGGSGGESASRINARIN